MTKTQLRATLLLAVLALPFCSIAKGPGIMSRFQVGFTFPSNQAEYTSSAKISIVGLDTTYKATQMKTSAAWGFTAGTAFMLKRIGNASSLCLSVDYMYNMMTWKGDVPGGLASESAYTFDGATVQMGLPVGLDLKFGGEATTIPYPRVCATLGAGVYPSYAVTTLSGAPETFDPAFSVAPYLKAEVGFRAGLCMKLRMLYAIGDMKYLDFSKTDNSLGENYSKAALTGKSNLAISLLIMPFSYKWKTEEWWNTF